MRVVPNKFPALRIEGGLDRKGLGAYDRMNGVGAHEVIIETPQHNLNLADAPVEHIQKGVYGPTGSAWWIFCGISASNTS